MSQHIVCTQQGLELGYITLTVEKRSQLSSAQSYVSSITVTVVVGLGLMFTHDDLVVFLQSQRGHYIHRFWTCGHFNSQCDRGRSGCTDRNHGAHQLFHDNKGCAT